MKNKKLALLLLRIGVAFVFAYAAIASFVEPDIWISYFPQILLHTFPQKLLLIDFSIFELLLAAWILWGWKIFYSSLIGAALILGIMLFNLQIFDVVFRDVTILFACLSLALFAQEKK